MRKSSCRMYHLVIEGRLLRPLVLDYGTRDDLPCGRVLHLQSTPLAGYLAGRSNVRERRLALWLRYRSAPGPLSPRSPLLSPVWPNRGQQQDDSARGTGGAEPEWRRRRDQAPQQARNNGGGQDHEALSSVEDSQGRRAQFRRGQVRHHRFAYALAEGVVGAVADPQRNHPNGRVGDGEAGIARAVDEPGQSDQAAPSDAVGQGAGRPGHYRVGGVERDDGQQQGEQRQAEVLRAQRQEGVARVTQGEEAAGEHEEPELAGELAPLGHAADDASGKVDGWPASLAA